MTLLTLKFSQMAPQVRRPESYNFVEVTKRRNNFAQDADLPENSLKGHFKTGQPTKRHDGKVTGKNNP
jgi:hypothetical protein